MFSVVVKGLIVNDKKILVIQRSLDEEVAPGVWELVGGRVNIEESLEEGLIREIKEETSIDASIIRLLYATDHYDSIMGKVVILVYLCKPLNYKVVISEEHSDYKWVNLKDFRELVFKPILNDLDKYSALSIYELK